MTNYSALSAHELDKLAAERLGWRWRPHPKNWGQQTIEIVPELCYSRSIVKKRSER